MTRRLADEDFNDDRKDAGEMGAGHAVTALYEVTSGDKSGAAESVDPLRYQRRSTTAEARRSRELLTVKVRYKTPPDQNSRLLELAFEDSGRKIEAASENLRFAAAVAEYGMLLHDSKFKGESTWESAAALAESARGDDPDGRRSEFVYLLKTAARLAASMEISQLR